MTDTMTITGQARAAAALGAAYFDLHLGAGWARSEALDTSKLDMRSGRWDVLGQTHYDAATMDSCPEIAWMAGVRALGLTDEDLDALGLDAPPDLHVRDEQAYYAALDEAWSDLIATRRAA
jgi:hypothetical protein